MHIPPTNQPESSSELTPLVSWLHQHELALPAWMLVEAVRPFGWLLGQACLMAQPLVSGLGGGDPLRDALRWLDNPDALAALSAALAPDRETP